MLCAISLRQEKNKHGEDIDVLEQRYIHYFEKFGLKLLLIPNGHDVDYYFEKFPIERVVLSGGNDVDPQMYGGKREEGDVYSFRTRYNRKKDSRISCQEEDTSTGNMQGDGIFEYIFWRKID